MVPPLKSWSAPSGRFVLLGDAAHALPPTLAQGAAMAIEDSALLSRLLSSLSTVDQLKPAMKIFEAIRIHRTSAVRSASILTQDIWHLVDDVKEGARDEAACSKDRDCSPYIYENPTGQEWLYGFDAEMV